MRWCLLIAVLCAAACDKSPPADEAAAPKNVATRSVAKLPPPDKPLPPLAKDPGGATGSAQWGTGIGGLGIDSPRDVLASGDDIFVVGQFEGDCTFGPLGVRKAVGGTDAFLARLDKDGVPTWAQTFGGPRDDVARGIAVRGDTVVIVGNFLDEMKLGEFAHKTAGSDDLFVAAFDRKGVPQWLWTAGGPNSDGANAVAATPDGGWIVGGSFRDTAKIGDALLTSKGGSDAILIKLAATGDVEWVKQFGGFYDDTIIHLAVDAQGSIYVQGQFRDTSDWGGKPLKAAGGSDFDVVLAKYDANGEHVWSQRFGNAFNDVAGGVTVDPAGFVTMAGSFDKEILVRPRRHAPIARRVGHLHRAVHDRREARVGQHVRRRARGHRLRHRVRCGRQHRDDRMVPGLGRFRHRRAREQGQQGRVRGQARSRGQGRVGAELGRSRSRSGSRDRDR